MSLYIRDQNTGDLVDIFADGSFYIRDENTGDLVEVSLTLSAGESGVTNGDKGDITVSNAGATWTIDVDSVTFAKLQNISTDKLLGRVSGGTGDIEEITISDFVQTLLDDADAGTFRASIGAGTGNGTVTSVGLTVSGAIHSVTGSPITGSGTLALNLLNQNANRVFAGPTSGSAGAPTFRALVEADVPFRTLRRYAGLIQEDFIAGIGPGLSLSNNGSGAGATNADNANLDLGGFPGWLVMTTGTTNTGRTVISPSASGPIVLGSGAWHHEALVRLPAVSDGTETFVVVSGFNDSPEPATAPVDGVYFRYSHGDNGGKWQCICRSNSFETAADSGVSAAATTNYRLQIEINAAGTSAEFLINGTSVATIGTNIPVGVPRYTRWLPAGIGKTAGTTARTLLVDYIETWCVLTTAR